MGQNTNTYVIDDTCSFKRGAFVAERLSCSSGYGLLRARIERNRTFKGGSIIFGLAAAVDCVIRNLSDEGASIEVVSHAGIPDDFAFLIKPEAVKRNCHIEWRSAKRIGVHFV